MKYVFLSLGCIIAGKAISQDTMRLSLADAVAYAEKNSPTYQNAQTDVLIYEQTVKQITASGLPQITGGATYTDYVQIPGSYIRNIFDPSPGAPEYIKITFQQKYNVSANLALNQLIFDGTFFLGLKAAKEYVNLASLIVVKSKNELQANVAKSYLMALTTAKNIELIKSNLATLEKSFEDVSALYKEGFAEKLDVQRLELAVSNLRIQKSKLENASGMTLNLLKMQMGLSVLTPIKLLDNLESVDVSIPMAESVTNGFDITNRIESKIFSQALSLSKMDEKRYKLGYFPSLYGYLQHQEATNRSQFNFFKSNLTPNNNFVPGTFYGFSLQVPIFDGFRKHSQIQQVKLNRMKTENEKLQFENAANFEYTTYKSNYLINLKQAADQKVNLDLAKEIYEKANVKFKEGVGSTLEIMQADTELKNAQTNYLNALYDLVVSKIDLKKSTGIDLLK